MSSLLHQTFIQSHKISVCIRVKNGVFICLIDADITCSIIHQDIMSERKKSMLLKIKPLTLIKCPLFPIIQSWPSIIHKICEEDKDQYPKLLGL